MTGSHVFGRLSTNISAFSTNEQISLAFGTSNNELVILADLR